MTKKFLPAVALLLLTSLSGQAQVQVPADYAIYDADASYASPLCRGREATKYNFVHEGTCYWFSDDFLPGTINYNDKTYYNVRLNIDAYENLVQVIQGEGVVKVVLDQSLVRDLTIAGTHFVNLRALGYDMPEGCYQAVYEGKASIFRKVTKSIEKREHDVGSGGSGYSRKLIPVFIPKETFYYIGPDGSVSRISSRGDIYSKYPERKKELRRICKQKHLNGKKNYEDFCREMLKYVEGDER